MLRFVSCHLIPSHSLQHCLPMMTAIEYLFTVELTDIYSKCYNFTLCLCFVSQFGCYSELVAFGKVGVGQDCSLLFT